MLRCQVAADKWDLGGLEFCASPFPRPKARYYAALRGVGASESQMLNRRAEGTGGSFIHRIIIAACSRRLISWIWSELSPGFIMSRAVCVMGAGMEIRYQEHRVRQRNERAGSEEIS